MNAAITITANGAPFETMDGILIPEYLKAHHINPDSVVVERNGEALTRSEAADTQLHDGDRLEIVRIVAGG